MLLTSCHDRSADSAPARCHEVVPGHELLVDPPPLAGRPGPRQSDQDAERAGGAVHGRHGEARQTGGGAQDVHHERQRWGREEIMTNVLPLRMLSRNVWMCRLENERHCVTLQKEIFHQSIFFIFFSVYEKVGVQRAICQLSHPASVLVLSQIRVKVLTAAA